MPRRRENGRERARARSATGLHARYAARPVNGGAESRPEASAAPIYMRGCPVCGHFTASLDARLLNAVVECPDCKVLPASSGTPLRL